MGCGGSAVAVNGADFLEEYQIDDAVIGKGSYGTVYKCYSKKDNQVYAAKTIEKTKLTNPQEEAVVHNEIEVMRAIDHKNCIKLVNDFESKQAFTLVQELVTGGELFDRIVEQEKYSEKDAATTMHELAESLAYLHARGIVHRDLKPENLLYADDSSSAPLKITDFGLAKKMNDGKLATQCGTPNYVAPEILGGNEYGAPVDMWSCGVILYILLCGVPPFYAEVTKELYEQIQNADYEFPDDLFESVSEDAKEVIRQLLTLEPNKRMTAQQLLSCPWVNGGATDTAMNTKVVERMQLIECKMHLRQFVHAVIGIERINAVINEDNHEKFIDQVNSLKHNAHLLSSDAEEQELMEAFNVLSGSSVGELTTEQLKARLDAFGHNHTLEKINENFISRVDHDNNGSISFEEFEFLMRKLPLGDHLQELKQCFAVLDADSDGGITAEELLQALDKLEQHEKKQNIDIMVKSVDLDQDGEINFDEFHSLMNEGPPMA